MRPSTTRFLSGIVMVAFLGCGVVGAEAGSGSDAGVGISGKLDYDHPANGSGPAITRRHYNDGLRHSAAELASILISLPRGEKLLQPSLPSAVWTPRYARRAQRASVRRDASSPRSTGNESAPLPPRVGEAPQCPNKNARRYIAAGVSSCVGLKPSALSDNLHEPTLMQG